MTPNSIRNKINKELHSLPTYSEKIPLADIFAIIKKYGGTVVDEDGTEWSGFLCGEAGQTTFDITGIKASLILTWYTMPSGRYETVSYVS